MTLGDDMKITVSFDVDVDLSAQAAFTGQSVAQELVETLAYLRVAVPRIVEGQSFMTATGKATALVDLDKNA
jgi:hypothetical protein